MSPKIRPLQQPAAPHPTAQATTIHPPTFDVLPDSGYAREAQLVASPERPGVAVPLPFSPATLWRKVRNGSFPKPVKLGVRMTAWRVSEIRAWMAAQEAQPHSPSAAVVAAVAGNLAKRTAQVQA